MEVKNYEDVAFLLSFANDMRREKGDALLDDLPISDRGQPESCIIANAFNYGCEVQPHAMETRGNITFQTQEDRDTYLKVMDIPFEEDRWYELCLDSELQAPLTKELNRIACLFDNGELFYKYTEEYDELDDEERAEWNEENNDPF